MLSGSEAVGSAVKIARKWAYLKKGILADQAWFRTADRCYYGITLATIPLSNNIAEHFGQHVPNMGPFTPTGRKLIQYGELEVLTEALEKYDHKIAAFIIEPIQGLAGMRVPQKGYLNAAQDLCQKHNVLFICDEHEGVKSDLVTLGKVVTGDIYPMSVVMGKKHVMDVIGKYEVASTFASSPVTCAAALAALDVLEDENMSEPSRRIGQLLESTIKKSAPPHIIEHRGIGVFRTLVLDESTPDVTARRVAELSALRGVLVGNGMNRLGFSPPLTISEEDLVNATSIVMQAIRDVETLGGFPGSDFIN